MTDLELGTSNPRHEPTPVRRDGLQACADSSHFGVQLWPSWWAHPLPQCRSPELTKPPHTCTRNERGLECCSARYPSSLTIWRLISVRPTPACSPAVPASSST